MNHPFRFLALSLATTALGLTPISWAAAGKNIEDVAAYIQKAPRSLDDRVFTVWDHAGRFTKNPDIIALPSGRLLIVYSDTDSHFSKEDQHLILLASDDQGKTWHQQAEIDTHDMRKGEERLVTPRLSRLKDGRLIALIDQDDFGHFHEDQSSGIMCYWSKDDGVTWTRPVITGAKGIEPDRVQELNDGTLIFGSHMEFGADVEYGDVLYASIDGGKSWAQRAVMAHDGYHRFCEGGIVQLDDGKELACIMRENHNAGEPSFVVFSKDNGQTWSKPQPLPFAFHRPYVKQLPDGRVLVSGRNVLGGLGTFAWCGDLHSAAGHYEAGGPASRFTAQLTPEALVIENQPETACRYTLLPPESPRSQIVFEARVKVEGPPGVPVAFLSLNRIYSVRGPRVLSIASDGLWMSKTQMDERKSIDMTSYHDVSIRLHRGLMQVYVDDQIAFNSRIYWETLPLGDTNGDDPAQRTQFGQLGSQGRSYWQRVTYTVVNQTQPAFQWQWQCKDGRWPDQYQRDHLIQVYANPLTPQHHPDHGYTSWLPLADGRILLVDYTNRGAPTGKSHLVGVYITPEDLREQGVGVKTQGAD